MPSASSSQGNVHVADNGGALRVNAVTFACITGTIAFAVYTRTLLPGVDLGDTGGFQAAVLWPETSARQAYPLYYGLARPLVLALSATNPARGLNLFSAICASLAVGLLTFVSGVVVRSALAGAAAGLLLAFSYTFWTQAVIAEVYGLHLALIAACLIALQAYASRPSTMRLGIFFALYALSFGNHLTMILLLVPFAMFLMLVHPAPRELLRPRTIALALAIAVGGALLYTPNFLFIWTNIEAPASWTERMSMFWFDTTKADWRATMMLGVTGDQVGNRLAMWMWDARQQFGIAGLAIAAIGAIRLWWILRPWAVLAWSAYAISTAFAVTYNVGDTHVFFLPGHLFTAFAAAAAFAPVNAWRVRAVTLPKGAAPALHGTRESGRSAALHAGGPDGPPLHGVEAGPQTRLTERHWPPAATALRASGVAAVLLYAGWRAWDTWPAVDRHLDRRADVLVARLAAGLNDTNAVVLSELDWQSENALLYSARYERRDLAWTRLAAVMLHLPYFVRDNQEIGRDVVLTAGAAASVEAAYASLFPIIRDEMPAAPSLSDIAQRLPLGAPYVLCLLTPAPGDRLDTADFEAALAALSGNHRIDRSTAAYQVWAGVAGEKPAHHIEASRPVRKSFSIAGDPFTVRIESWLPFDTFRRGGFGHVLRGHQHLLTIERGVSLVWFDNDGTPVITYAAGSYGPAARFRIAASAPQQVAAGSGAILGRESP